MTTVVFVIWFLGQGSPKPFVSVTNVAAAQVAHGLPVLRKRHETDRAEGFSSIGITVNPFSMSARGKCSETCLYRNACSYTEVRVEKTTPERYLLWKIIYVMSLAFMEPANVD